MSIQHHSDNSDHREALDRFMSQITGSGKRAWPNGRINGEDDGATAYAIAADPVRKVILIRFPKPMEWIGFDVKSAAQLRDALTAKISELTQAPTR